MAESRLTFERRMTDHEALMWVLEQDPVLRSSFSNVTLFDRPVDPDRFRARMEQAVGALPRLRQRVVDAPGGVLAPEWVDDPMFDLDFHVRRIAVPAPGEERHVLDLAALLSEDPFDRARPLWQFVLVEGLAGGAGAMIQKLHHTITDGEGGVRLSAMFVDLERDADRPMAAVEPAEMEPGRSPVGAVRDTVVGGMRVPLDVARSALGGAIETITHPRRAPARAAEVLETARSVVRQLAVTEPARSPLWAERSLRRRLEVLDIGLDDAKQAARRLGGTVNDLFVTGAVGAAGAYHRAQGVEVEELRMAMPVSTRQPGDDGAGANRFTPTRTLVPVGIVDPAERFAAVQAVLATTKAERAVGAAASMAGLLNTLPQPMIVRLARQQVGTVDFTTSNVRGAPFELYIGGAQIRHNYPIGPMAGTAFNLTTLSYGGRLDMGCAIDTVAVDDPELLRACLVEAYDELLAAGGVTPG